MADPFKNAPEARQDAASLLDVLARNLRVNVEALVLTPDLQIAHKVIDGYEGLLKAIEEFGERISTSNPGYWRRDLSDEVDRNLRVARHSITVLNALYAPTEIESSKPIPA